MAGSTFGGQSDHGDEATSGRLDQLIRGPRSIPAVVADAIAGPADALGGEIVRRRSRRVIILLSAIIVLSVADLVVTLTHLTTTGMIEANPIAAWLIRNTQSPWSLTLLKAVSVGTAVFVLFQLRRRIQGEIGSWCALGILVVVAFLWHTYSQSFDSPQDVQLAQSGFYGDNWMVLD